MKIFEKEINLKSYACSKIKEVNFPIHPIINLYIQTTPLCNGKCQFCDTRNHSKDFNFDKLDIIISEMKTKNILGKIAIAGGEPLLVMDRSLKIATTYQNEFVTLNTNAFDIKKIKKIEPFVKQIDVSKHHFNNAKNDEILGIHTSSIQKIVQEINTEKITINSVFQKNGLSTKEDLYELMQELGKNHIKKLKVISLLPLNNYAIENYVSTTKLMQEFEHELNDGYLYDKDMCQCFRFLFITNSGNLVETTIRETFNDNYSCVKQFVYDGEYLYDGFKKNNILI